MDKLEASLTKKEPVSGRALSTVRKTDDKAGFEGGAGGNAKELGKVQLLCLIKDGTRAG